MTMITLSNGKKVGNFSSPHPFEFEDGSILPAVTPEEAERLKVDFTESYLQSLYHVVADSMPGDVELSFKLNQAVWVQIHNWWLLWKDKKVDVVFCPLPMITALKEYGACWLWASYINSPFRAIRIEDRIKKLVSIHKQCI